jgi:elongation factor Ts
MAITAAQVKELRERTGSGMMECKKALVDHNGDMHAAIEALRKAGMAKADKKASRIAAEGLVVIETSDDGRTAAVVEVNCETDFVAKKEDFQAFASAIARRVLSDNPADLAALLAMPLKDGDATTIEDTRKGLIATIGENMQVRRVVRWSSANGAFATYSHMGGKLGVLVEAEGNCDEELLADICMHVAAFNPTYITTDEIPAEAIAKEREIAAAQMAGKPANIIENIVNGKINKWYSEVCLMKQPWLRDDKSCLGKIAPGLIVKRLARWQLGS